MTRWCSLVHMCANCGAIGEARASFDELSVKDIVSWTCAIVAYGSHGWKQPMAAKYLAKVEEVEREAEAAESSAEEGFSSCRPSEKGSA